jgi:hypothetical protein
VACQVGKIKDEMEGRRCVSMGKGKRKAVNTTGEQKKEGRAMEALAEEVGDRRARTPGTEGT